MDTKIRQKVESHLREAELKLTPQRFAILDFLVGSDVHPTAEQISEGVNRRFPRASRATIYNTLKALRDAGVVQEVYLGEGAARYEANLAPHHHFVCRACGKLEDVSSEAVGALPPCELGAGYAVETFEVVLRGVCAACAAKRERRKRRR
ncbi:MAG TPA: Fur family transcriptional regulator [Pyrinomonadaceae bacterium]|jgi:Fur family ferric uptake transcriptional regulator/Fur family peroxide stress response transcriptional regulator|nr:Fur family transcriptional regulator [Pyrinomonadaceae bacterium]